MPSQGDRKESNADLLESATKKDQLSSETKL
jgi:hypothetical protein